MTKDTPANLYPAADGMRAAAQILALLQPSPPHAEGQVPRKRYRYGHRMTYDAISGSTEAEGIGRPSAFWRGKAAPQGLPSREVSPRSGTRSVVTHRRSGSAEEARRREVGPRRAGGEEGT